MTAAGVVAVLIVAAAAVYGLVRLGRAMARLAVPRRQRRRP